MPNTIPPSPVPERTSHPFYTYDMIHEIPTTISKTLRNDRIVPAAKKLSERKSFYFTGCGTAFFSAMLGAEPLRPSKIRSLCVPALELEYHNYPVDAFTGVVVADSHSGITKTTVDALKYAPSNGAFGIGITHFLDRPIFNAANETLLIGNSPDNSRCHTKCYVAGAVLCCMCENFNGIVES